MPDALPDATLPISRLGTGSTNGSNNRRGWGKIKRKSMVKVKIILSKVFLSGHIMWLCYLAVLSPCCHHQLIRCHNHNTISLYQPSCTCHQRSPAHLHRFPFQCFPPVDVLHEPRNLYKGPLTNLEVSYRLGQPLLVDVPR
jgi:hypothetical protein